MTASGLHSDWLRLVLEADGLSEYRDTKAHHHRVDWVGRWLSVLSTAVVGFVVVSAAMGVARSRPQVTAERDELRQRVVAEQALTAQAEARYNAARVALRDTQAAVRPDLNGELAAALDLQGVVSAYIAMRGPGIVLTLDDAKRPTFSGTTDLGRIIDRDVQHAVNALWQSGAEAVSVNGVRLTARTSIRNAGTAILVDYQPIATPVVIRAIGGAAKMAAAFRELPEWEELAQLRDRYRIQWSFVASRSMQLPAGASGLPNYARSEGGS